MGSNQNGKTATARQLEYIKALQGHLGITDLKLPKILSVKEASEIIESLLCKMAHPGQEKMVSQTLKVNEPRLGMAMKECFRLWRSKGHDIYEKRRDFFKEDVMKTYYLFTEIAEMVEQGQQSVVSQGGAGRSGESGVSSGPRKAKI